MSDYLEQIEKYQTKLIVKSPNDNELFITRQDYVSRYVGWFFLFLVGIIMITTVAAGDVESGVSSSVFAVVWFGLIFLIWAGFFTRGWRILVVFERLKLDKKTRKISGLVMTYADFDEVKYVYMRPLYGYKKRSRKYILGIRLQGVNKILLGDYVNKETVENAGIQIANLISVPFEELK